MNNETLSTTDGTYLNYINNYYKKKLDIKNEVIDWLCEFEFIYFITITFSFNINKIKRDEQICSVLNMLSNSYYNRNQRKNGSFIDGFCIIENENTRNCHYHTLIKNDKIFNFKRNRNKDFKKVIIDKCSIIETFNKRSINTKVGLNIKSVYSEGIIGYLNKTYEKTGNFNFIHPLDKNGFSSIS